MAADQNSADPNALLKRVVADLGARSLLGAEAFQKFKALLPQGGLPWTRLIEVGVPANEVFDALSRATSVPIAPIERLKKPDRNVVPLVPADAAWKLLAAPFGREGELVEIAFADPRTLAAAKSSLPPHRAYLAIEAHVRKMLTAFYGAEPVAPIPLTHVTAEPDVNAKTFIRTADGQPIPTARSGTDGMPTQVASYAIERVIGRGGMATVYLGRDGQRSELIAVKLMQPHLLQDQTFVQRFLQEAKATGSLRHENLVQLYAWGESSAGYYMASEYVDGGTVEDLITKVGKMPSLLAVDIMAQTLRGLSYAHQAGVIHRDLKPQNMLVSRSGVLKIADFGIAKTAGAATLTQTGMLVGTPAYMSPEQAEGKDIDARSDLFTAGVILYELLSGHCPFAHENPTVSLTKVATCDAPPLLEIYPAVAPELDAIVERLMAPNRDARYPDAASALADLEAYARTGGKLPGVIVADALADPKGTAAQLRSQEADALFQKAQAANGPQSLLMLHRALLLDPNHEGAKALWGERAEKEGIKLDGSSNPKIAELESSLAQNPNAPGVLQQLANLHRLEGNLPRAVLLLRRYVKLRPKDGYVASQLQQLTGEQPVRLGAASTAALVAGIRTGGFAKPSQGQRETKAVAAPAAAAPKNPEEEGIVFYDPNAAPSAQWKKLAAKYWPAAAVVLVLVLAVRGVIRWIDHTSDDSYKTTVQLSDAMAAQKMKNFQQTNDQQVREAGDEESRLSRKELESAKELYDQGQYALAAEAFKNIRLQYPTRSVARTAQVMEARALTESGKAAAARELMDAFIAANPKSIDVPEAMFRRGEAYAKSGSQAMAINDFNEIVKQFPSSPFSNEALYQRAELRLAAGEKEDAVADANLLLAKVQETSELAAKAKALLQRMGK